MPKTNAQHKADERARKRARGLVKKELWVFPQTWDEIKRYADKKTDRQRMIREANELQDT